MEDSVSFVKWSPVSFGKIFAQTRSWLYENGELLALSMIIKLVLTSRSCVQVPFVIVDKNQWSQSSFLVVNMDGARQPLPLTTVYNRLQPINSSPYAFLQALFFPEYPVSLIISVFED